MSAGPEALRGVTGFDNNGNAVCCVGPWSSETSWGYGATPPFRPSFESRVCSWRSEGGTGATLCRDEDNCARVLTGDSIEESEGSSELASVVLEALENSGAYSLPPLCEGVVSPENKRDSSGPSSFSLGFGCTVLKGVWDISPFARVSMITLDPFEPCVHLFCFPFPFSLRRRLSLVMKFFKGLQENQKNWRCDKTDAYPINGEIR